MQQTIDRAQQWLVAMGGTVQHLLVGPDAWPLFALLFVLELWMLYGLFRRRGAAVVVFNHYRLVLAVAVMSSMTVAYWRLAILTVGTGWIRYLGFAVAVTLVSMFVVTVLHQIALFAINAMSNVPITKDLERPELSGKDCNYSVIRRWADFLMVWFVLVPGLIVTLPTNMTVVSMLLVPWLFLAIRIVVMAG